MDLEPKAESEQVIGSMKNCFVEGDLEQQRRERRTRRRALVVSITLQTIVVAALVLFPSLGKSERIRYEQNILPPYAPHGPIKENSPKGKPQTGVRPVCIVCFTSQNPPRLLKPGDRVDTTLNEHDGDYVPVTPSAPGITGGLDLNSPRRLPEPPRDRADEPARRLRLTTVEPAMLTHSVEPQYPPLARQLHREGRVELRAIIATDGTIQSLEVASGDPLFYQSALAAVREWRYRPTFLDGQAVEIDTHITVVYSLNH